VTTSVADLCVTSPANRHRIEISERSGAFVALTIHRDDATRFRLAALDPAGSEIDRVDYRDPWSRDG
jgi:hypothetical protein